MKVKDILTLAIKLLDKKELLSHSIFLPQPPQEIEESPLDKEIEDLLFCFNLIYDEIATDFMPLIHTEKIFFENGGGLNLKTLKKQCLTFLLSQTQMAEKLSLKHIQTSCFATKKKQL